MEKNKSKIVTRTQVYLDDPEFFCNKSWTLSFNMNTKRWVSFHSYLPNWYIGENNFFYSGKNDCCGDIEGNFQALVGVLNRDITTTTTTSLVPSTTTTTTTVFISDCELIGTGYLVSCNLEGTGIITIPPTTTTTICQRPIGLTTFTLYKGYQITGDPEVVTSGSLENTCESFGIINTPIEKTLLSFDIMTLSSSLSVGDLLYYGSGISNCIFPEDGWYYDTSGLFNGNVYHVVNGYIVEIANCSCTTTTTTTQISFENCCDFILTDSNELYLYSVKRNSAPIKLDMTNLPSTISKVAYTSDHLWTDDGSEYKQWDITLNPFTSVYNKVINYPASYSTSLMTAKDNSTLIVFETHMPPHVTVSEINISGTTGVLTKIFDINDINPLSNILYTTNKKLIFIATDLIDNNNYIYQYNYLSENLELKINIDPYEASILFECDCFIYFKDEGSDNVYNIKTNYPYEITKIGELGDFFVSAAQQSLCITGSFITTTSTTTTVP